MTRTTFATPTTTPRTPPKVAAWPLVGSVPPFYWRKLDFLLQARATYGDIYTLDLAGSDVIVLGHPRHAQHVLQDHASNYRTKGGATGFRASSIPLGGDGVTTTPDPDAWRRQRRAVQPFFHKNHFDRLTSAMTAAIAESIAPWQAIAEAGTPLEMAEAVTQISMKAVIKMVFGVDVEPRTGGQLAQAVNRTLDYMWEGMLAHLIPTWWPSPGRRHFQHALQSVDEMIHDLIEQALQPTADPHNLMQMLWRKGQEEGVTEAQLRDEAVTMMFGASEALPAALSWTFYLVTRYPQVQRQVQAEVDLALDQNPPTLAHLPQLAYTRMVLQESFRLYAPIYWIQRMASEDDDIDGFAIPKGSIVVVLIHLIHHHPDIWQDPERFEPERFTPERTAPRHKLAWMPFGAGQRVCSAREHSLMLGQLLLAQVCQCYHLEAVPGRTTGVKLSTSLEPKGGVWATLERRG
ncbi:MAG: cytochrome P450 [Candidatus Tectomicrobia bacterium]|nr:cytochrome P450 [Candidatus Tectomicrobia bacterium]